MTMILSMPGVWSGCVLANLGEASSLLCTGLGLGRLNVQVLGPLTPSPQPYLFWVLAKEKQTKDIQNSQAHTPSLLSP